MKTVYLLLIIGWSIIPAFSQSINGFPLDSIDVQYISVNFPSKGFAGQVYLAIDYGQEAQAFGFSRANYLKDEHDEFITFNSKMDALNFLFKHGYQLHRVNKDLRREGASSYLLERLNATP